MRAKLIYIGKALGRNVEPKRWAVLYLGSAKVSELDTDAEITMECAPGQPAVVRKISF